MLSVHDRAYTPDYKLEPPRPQRPVYVCCNCGEGIGEGEDYWDICGKKYCAACMKEAKHTAQHNEY